MNSIRVAASRSVQFWIAQLGQRIQPPELLSERTYWFVTDTAIGAVVNQSEQGDSPNGRAYERCSTTVEGEDFLIRLGNLRMRVQPKLGGRITEFGFGDQEMLTGPSVVEGGDHDLRNMYGSTFWTSPQAAWGWPPEAEVDREPYTAALQGDVLTLTGRAGASTGYAVVKRFSVDAQKGCINVAYRMLNGMASVPPAALPAAPWEISRVHKRGLVVFPTQSQPTPESNLRAQVLEGVAWLDISKAPTGDCKLFQKGSEGWLAYVEDGWVLIKTFDNIFPAEQAPGEAEIEIFISGAYDYVELEQQGRYAEQPAGSEADWTVGWWLEALPPKMSVTPGNKALVDWIRQVITGGRQ